MSDRPEQLWKAAKKASFGLAFRKVRGPYPKQVLRVWQHSQFLYLPSPHEDVVGQSVSGVQDLETVLPLRLLHTTALHGSFIKMWGSTYESPLAGRPTKRYRFYAVDTVAGWTVVRFEPKRKNNAELLQGSFLARKGAVANFTAFTQGKNGSVATLALSNPLQAERWPPSSGMAVYTTRIASLENTLVQAQHSWQSARYAGTKEMVEEKKPAFAINNELHQHKNLQHGNSSEGTAADSSTSQFFNRIPPVRFLDKAVNFSDHLSQRRLPLSDRSFLDLDKLLVANAEEVLRPGLGLHIAAGRRSLIGGYVGYGLADGNLKYGLDWVRELGDRSLVKAFHSRDLHEPGLGLPYSFPPNVYGSLPMRRASVFLPRFDQVDATGIAWAGLSTAGVRYQVQASHQLHQPRYTYAYRDQPASRWSQGVIAATASFQPGERLARFSTVPRSLGSRYPRIMGRISYHQGLSGLPAFEGLRSELGATYIKRILGLGTLTATGTAGMVQGSVPYALLGNAPGTFERQSRFGTAEFQTMGFNQFVASRWAHLFISHSFMRFRLGSYPFLPYFQASLNAGWGSLAQPQQHTGVSMRDYPKGYYEAGLGISDLFEFRLPGLRVGLGLGGFTQLGAYASAADGGSTVYKLMVNIKL